MPAFRTMQDLEVVARSSPWRHARSARTAVAPALAWAGTAAILAVAPFERVDARVLLPGQAITTVEAVVVAAVGAWAIALLAGGRSFVWRTPIAAPAILFLAALAVASLAAPEHQANALRFTGRVAAGLAVCLLAVNAAASTDRAVGLMRVAAASGASVGAIAILEFLQVPAVLRFLTHFRETAHAVGGTLRMTSTLQYPTIASMYLEISFAFALAVFVLEIDRGSTRRALLTGAAALLIAEGIVLTLTRAGLITMAASMVVVLAGLAARRGFDRACRAVGVLAALVAVCLLATWPAAPLRARLTTEGHGSWYRAAWEAPASLTMRPGEWQRVSVTVRNDGLVAWRSDEDPPFRLSYHWLTESGDRVVQFDGQRTAFPDTVAPGDRVSVPAVLRAPERPGRYRLMWDVVQEHRLWFSTERSPTAVTDVEVAGALAVRAPVAPPTMALPPPNVRLGRLALWRIAAGMFAARPLVGVGPDNFRLLYGARAGLDRPDPRVHTNNMYLETFVGAGVLGGLLFLWLLWRAARPLARSLGTAPGPRLVAALGAAAALAAVLIHGFVDSFLTFTPTYVLIWITLGLAVRLAGAPGDPAHADRI
jgi:hypothetical protein